MNFLGHHYGVESFNHTAVKSVGKGMNPEKVKQGLVDLKKYFESHGSMRYRGLLTFIIGLPGETVEDLRSTTNWLIDNWKGQSWSPFVLEIPIGELNRLSKMSMDYTSYGYREYKGEAEEIDFQQARTSAELLVWENDNLNYFKAYHVFTEMMKARNNIRNGFTLSPWDLAMIGLSGSVADRLELHISELIGKPAVANRHKFINEYKIKKLQ